MWPFKTKQTPPINYATTYPLQIPANWGLSGYLSAYKQVGWLFGCVSRIAQSVADNKWRLYQTMGDEREEIQDHPILTVLNYVNPWQTGQELFEVSQMYLDLIGESCWILNPNKLGYPQEIWPVPPTAMSPVASKGKFISGWVYTSGGVQITFEPERVFFVKYPDPTNPYRGVGPAQSIGVDLQTEINSTKWNNVFFANSATGGTVIEYPNTITPGEYERIKTKWEDQYQGIANAHKLVVLQGGAKINRVMLSQKDMDFSALRKVNRDVILGAYGMPLSILGIEAAGSRARVDADIYTFAKYIIRPRLARWREKLNEQFVPLFGDGLELDFDDPVPEDKEATLKEASEGLRAGYLTINEARQMMGLDEVSNGDVFVMPITMTTTPAAQPKAILPAQTKLLGNEECKETFWQSYVAKATSQENAYITALRGLFDKQQYDVLMRLGENPTDVGKIVFNQQEAEKDFTPPMTKLLTMTYTQAAQDANYLINPEPEHRSKDYALTELARKWLADRCALLVKGINETTRLKLVDVITEGLKEGESMDQIAERIEAVFADCSQRRASVIARTEVIAASNEGALEGYYQSRVIEKVQFYAALDERTCDDCMAYHNESVDLADASGIIPVHPQCRCTWLPVIG